MAVYNSDYTGSQIDDVVQTFDSKKMKQIDGIVERVRSTGEFREAVSLPGLEGGDKATVVTQGEKYTWVSLVNQKGQPNGLATLASDGKITRTELPFLDAASGSSNVSVVTQNEKYVWNDMVPNSARGAANGIAELDENQKVLSSQLPSYVDDVIEVATFSDLPNPGESGKIYVVLNTNLPYRWSGTQYVEVSSSLALGETESTAYRGDRGAKAYAHGVTNKGSQFALGFNKIQTNAEGHVIAIDAVDVDDVKGIMKNSKSALTIVPVETTITEVTDFTQGSLVFVQDSSNLEHFTLTFTKPVLSTQDVDHIWVGYNSDVTNTYAAAQEFVAASS